MFKLGLIGYGGRLSSLVTTYFPKFEHPVEIAAIADQRAEKLTPAARQAHPGVRLYASPEEMLSAENGLDGFMIGTNCNTHADFACLAASRRVPIFLEKPVAISIDQLRRMKAAFNNGQPPVVVSFPLRYTLLGQELKRVVDSQVIGTIEHVQYLNNVNYGDVYFYHWYRDFNITGGLFLQKAVHDFHLINFLLGEHPSLICAMKSRRVYGGQKNHDLECHTCPEREECPESSLNLFMQRLDYEEIPKHRRLCLFSDGHGNEDNGSALLEYPSGRQVSYSQNFFTRRRSVTRGGNLVGYKGTIQFDFYTAEIKVIMHHSPRTETIKIEMPAGSHWGGDLYLIENYLNVLRGKGQSGSPLKEGMISALTAIAARTSAETRTFQTIDFDAI